MQRKKWFTGERGRCFTNSTEVEPWCPRWLWENVPLFPGLGGLLGNISLQHHEFNHIKTSAEKNGAHRGLFPLVFSSRNWCFPKEAVEWAAQEVPPLFSPLRSLWTPLPRDINQDFCHIQHSWLCLFWHSTDIKWWHLYSSGYPGWLRSPLCRDGAWESFHKSQLAKNPQDQ